MKKKPPSIKINFIYTLSYQVLAVIVPLITTPYISRVLAPENIGIISYTTSICNYFLLIGNLGMATYAQLEIAKHRESKHDTSSLFFEINIARTTTMAIAIILYMIFISLTGEYKLMYWFLSANLIASLIDCSWFYQGLEEFKKVTIRNVAVKILSIVLIFTLVKDSGDSYIYVLILYGSTIAANAYLWVGLKKYIEKVNFKELKIIRHFKGCGVYFIPTIATILSVSIGKTLLGYMGGSNLENGFFEQAFKIQFIIIAIPSSLNLVMRPRMAYLMSNNQVDEVSRRMIYSIRFILFIMVAISFGLIGTADNIVPWFLGPGWDKVSILLQIFSICILFTSVSLCFSELYYLPYNKVSSLSAILYVGTAVNIIVNIILIPKYLSIGATIATVVSQFVVMALLLFFSRKDVKVWNIAKTSIKYFISGSIMLGFLYYLNTYIPATVFGFLILIICGFTLYIVVLIVLRDAFLMDAMRQVKSYFKKKNNK
jgi:O-antigen/teichoic acid export membrane protein